MEDSNNGKYSRRFCDERHNEVERRFKETNRRMVNMENTTTNIKNWVIGVLAMAIMNLVGIIGLLIQNVGG